MLLTEPFFKSFTTKKMVDSKVSAEVMLSVSLESKEKVDEMLSKALSLGATEGIFSGWMKMPKRLLKFCFEILL